MPGQIVFTRTLWGARSFAAHCAKLMTPALAALYGGSVCEPICPATDARNSSVASPEAINDGANACATWTEPKRFTASTRGQSSGSTFQKGKPNLPDPTPAAHTTWSQRP